MVGIGVGVGVGIGVELEVGVGVGDGVEVRVGVEVEIVVAVGIGVGIGVGAERPTRVCCAMCSVRSRPRQFCFLLCHGLLIRVPTIMDERASGADVRSIGVLHHEK